MQSLMTPVPNVYIITIVSLVFYLVWPGCVNLMVMEAGWHLHIDLCVRVSLADPVTWADHLKVTLHKSLHLTTMKRGCSKEGKAMTNAISCTTVVSAAEFILGSTCGKKAGRRQTDRGSINAETGWRRGSLSRQRCFTMPDQIIELHLQYYHCRLTFLWVCEITHERLLLRITMRHTRPIPWKEELRIKETAFPHYPVLRRSLMSHWQVKAVKTFCRPLKNILVTTLKHQTASRSPPEIYNELQRVAQKLTKFLQSLQCQ